MATTPKRPQDHQPKQQESSADEFFTFTVDGVEYTMPYRTLDKINFGFIRQNRRRDAMDYTLTALEALCEGDKEGEKILKVLDSMSQSKTEAVLELFGEHLGASLGE